MEQDNSIFVPLDLVVFEHKPIFSLNYKDSFWLWILNVVELDACFASLEATNRDVCLDIQLDLVGNNFGRAALNNQDTLVVVLLDDVGVGEWFNVNIKGFLVFFLIVCGHYFRSFNFGGLESGIGCD